MEIIIKDYRKDSLILFIIVSLITILSLSSLGRHYPYYDSFSKIDEGTVVVKDDSITTIIIPDNRR